MRFARLSGSFGHYDGLALIFGGVGLVVLSTVRFARTTRRLDDPSAHSARSLRAELFLSATIVVLVASYSIFMVLA